MEASPPTASCLSVSFDPKFHPRVHFLKDLTKVHVGAGIRMLAAALLGVGRNEGNLVVHRCKAAVYHVVAVPCTYPEIM